MSSSVPELPCEMAVMGVLLGRYHLNKASNAFFLQKEVAAIGILLGLALFFLSKQVSKNKTRAKIPQVPGSLPLLGNALQIGGLKNIAHKLHEWADKYGNECGAFQINLLGVDYIVLCREDVNLQVLRNRPFKVIRNSMTSEAIKSANADGMASSEGEDWKKDKRLVSPALSHAAIEDYFSMVKVVTTRLVQKWTRLSSKGSSAVTINQDCCQFLADVAGLVLLGTDFRSLDDPASLKASDMEHIGKSVLYRALSPVSYWKIPLVGKYLDGCGWAIDRFTRFVQDIVEKHETSHDPDCSTLVGKVVNMNKSSKKKQMSRQRVVGNVVTMFFASIDSGASNLATALWLLASDTTGLQDELSDEIGLICLDTTTVKQMKETTPRLQSFLYEVQRFYGAVPFQMLAADEEIPFMGSTVPSGTKFITLQRYTSCNPHSPPTDSALGPNGESVAEFCPRRWLVPGEDEKDRFSVKAPSTRNGAFLAFGHGMRICPGRLFSDSVTLFVLASLLKQFNVTLEANHPRVYHEMQLTDTPAVDIRLVLTPRKPSDC